jgi:hypothetical protein
MAQPSAAVAAIARAATADPVPTPTKGNPVDRFENRRSVGEQGLIFTNGAEGEYDVHRLSLERTFPENTAVNPPRMIGNTKVSSTYTGGPSNFRWQAVEADLDMITYPDGSKRPSLEPGWAVAGRGCFGDPLCVYWVRPSYDADHKFTAPPFGNTTNVRIPGQTPRPGTEVDIVTGAFGDDLEKSLIVTWVNTDDDVVVAHIYAGRAVVSEKLNRVSGLRLAGPPIVVGKALPGTSPSLAVGDMQATGSDQVAVVWAPGTSTPASRQFAAALIDVDAQRQARVAIPAQTFAPNVFFASPDQVTPGATVLRDTRGTGPTKHRLMVGPGIRSAGQLQELVVDGGAFQPRPYNLANSAGNLLPTSAHEGWPSYIESLGDITGDGLDELVSAPGLRTQSAGILDVISLAGFPAGLNDRYQILATRDTEPTIEVSVLDARRANEQAIAPPPGKIRVDKLPQIALSSSWAPGCPSGQRKAVFNLQNLNYSAQNGWSIGGGVQQDLSTCSTAVQIPQVASFALDGRAELGDPVKDQYTTLEPTVILNAPPTHFDILDGQMYDPNFCYAGNQYLVPSVCFFISEYELKQTASTEVSSESTEDWAVSAEASAEFSLFDAVSIETEITGGYGEKFTEIGVQTQTTTVEVNVKARNTDKIYAIKRTYDTLEYPIYQPGGTKPYAYVMATTPHTESKRWIDINSPDAINLNVNHQPGNILSYPEDITDEENPFISPTSPDGNSPLVGAFAPQEFELSDFSDFTYTLTQDKVDAASAAKQKDWNIGASIKGSGKVAGLVDVSLKVSGSYKNSRLSNTRTTIGSTTKLMATLGGVDESFGETAYTVKPFAYWDESAALVLDYAVSPVVAPPGAPKTWWQQKYGVKPDLTMKLPRLLDNEKQAGISSDAARFISPGVQIFQGPCDTDDPLVLARDYATPLQPLCARVQVENYSLKDQSGETTVEFYDADPDVGGTLLGTVTGVQPVGARQSKFVYFDWTPDARYAGTAPRIFAKVDSGGVVDEIHEDNNKGYRAYRALADATVAPRPADEVMAERGPGRSLNVTWENSQPNVQPNGHEWRVVVYPDEGGTPIEKTVPGSATSTSFTEVPAGRYRVAVFSVAGGQSSPASHPSEPVDIVVETPSAPQNVSGVPGNGSVLLSWDAPASTGGAPLDTYRIREVREPGQNFSEPPIDTVVNSGVVTALTLSGLTNGRPYRFSVQAINGAGPGDVSDASAAVVPVGVPSQPTDVKAVTGPVGSATVSWQAPAPSPARADVTGYEVVTSPGGVTTTVTDPSTSTTITGLDPLVSYTFTVRANSDSGFGPMSEPSAPTGVLGPPDRPTEVKAVKGTTAGTARVSWKPPAVDPDRADVTGYEVVTSPGGALKSLGTETSTTVDGLQPGVAYAFTVRANSSAGKGAESAASSPLTLAEPPGAAKNVRAVPGSEPRSVKVSWVAPTDTGGVPLDEFEVCQSGGTCQQIAATRDEVSFSGLSAGEPLTFTVVARNVAGLQSLPAVSPAVVLPTAPTITITRAPAPGSFTKPDVTIEFDVSPAVEEVTCFIDGTAQACASPLRLTGLADGSHTVRVRAASPGGTGNSALVNWRVDSRNPEAVIDDLPGVARKGKPRLRYSGSDRGGAGLAGYEIRTRENGVLGSFSNPVIASDPSTAAERVRRLSVARGSTVCASVRATDAAGNKSPWSAWQCSARPIDESVMTQQGRWEQVRAKNYSQGRALRALDVGSALTLRVGRTEAVSVLAVPCRTCGQIEVRHRGELLEVIDLSADSTSKSRSARTKVKEFPVTWPEASRGQLRLVALGGGDVVIDGVAIRRGK